MKRTRSWMWGVWLMIGLLVGGCLAPRKPTMPLRVVSEGRQKHPEQLVVMLPGRWSEPEEFRREGLMELAKQRWPKAQVVAPDLHLGYYLNRQAVVRLREDVVLPARRKGAKELIVVGVSMGGLGALLYDLEHPGEVDRMILLAPYVGEKEAVEEIIAAGGVRHWKPGEVKPEDFSRKVWMGLKRKWLERGDRPEVALWCGVEDRHLAANRRFAWDFLKPHEFHEIPGGHDWGPWRLAFAQEVARLTRPTR